MMRLLLLLFFIFSSASNAEASDSESTKIAAENMLAKRMQLLHSENYDGYRECDECWKSIRSASELNDYEKIIMEADRGLKVEPYSLRFLMAKSSALSELGRIEESDGVTKEWFSIADSIFMSGDGKSRKTAYIVLRVNEEYDVLSLLGLQRDRQSLIPGNDGRIYDLIEATDVKTGEKHKVYFDITVIFNSMKARFGKM